MQLRRVTSHEDRDAVLYLQIEILPDDTPLDPRDGAWWVLYDGTDPVAFAAIRPSRQWVNGMYLSRSGVVTGYRGQGLQKRLISVRERFARREGAEWLITDTTQNPASANNLADRGFRMYEPSAPWGNRYTLYWRKKV